MINAYSERGLKLAKIAVEKQEVDREYNKQEVIENMIKLGMTEVEANKLWFENYGNNENVITK